MSTPRQVIGVADEAWGDYARIGVTLGDERTPWCAVVNQNPLEAVAWLPGARDVIPGNRLLVWSGGMGASLFERSPATWLPDGLVRFRAWVDRALPVLRTLGVTLLVRPHARHVLCDAHRTRTFFDERPDDSLALAFAPTSILEPDMLDEAPTHLVRAYETLGDRCACLVLENVRPPVEPDGALEPVPLEEGVLDAEQLIRLAQEHVPAHVPVLVGGAARVQRSQADRLSGVS